MKKIIHKLCDTLKREKGQSLFLAWQLFLLRESPLFSLPQKPELSLSLPPPSGRVTFHLTHDSHSTKPDKSFLEGSENKLVQHCVP